MGKYIDASAIKAKIMRMSLDFSGSDIEEPYKRGVIRGMSDVSGLLELAPAADVAPVIHAKWETVTIEGRTHKTCSHCHIGCNAGLWWDFCPNCGARMDAET